MKKKLLILLIICLIFTGCGNKIESKDEIKNLVPEKIYTQEEATQKLKNLEMNVIYAREEGNIYYYNIVDEDGNFNEDNIIGVDKKTLDIISIDITSIQSPNTSNGN